MSAFPNHHSIPSIPVDTGTAHRYLEAYLEATKSSPYLLPNARLEPSGPTAGSSNSVTIYNLKRVEAGLRGEFLAPSLELEENNVPVAKGLDDGSNSKEGDAMDTTGWQDLDEYQRQQEVVEGELGHNDTELDNELEVKPRKVDKEARKKEKKLRAKEDKKKRAEAKKNAQSEE